MIISDATDLMSALQVAAKVHIESAEAGRRVASIYSRLIKMMKCRLASHAAGRSISLAWKYSPMDAVRDFLGMRLSQTSCTEGENSS